MLRPLFWDCDFSQISWVLHRDLVISRILANGTWEAIRWLRDALGDEGLREYVVAHRGRGLSPRQLRFWELILGIPRRTVSAWLKEPGRTVWEGRHVA